MAPTENQIVFFNALTHLPTKLTKTNFSVWRSQLHSALIGYNLLSHIDGTPKPAKTVRDPKDNTKTIENPDYVIWYRQDQLILNAILGSCAEEIQSHISLTFLLFLHLMKHGTVSRFSWQINPALVSCL